MDDHFHTSLQELRLQLDLMNSRTALILNKSRQQSNMLTPDSSADVQSPSVTADNTQQIKHIGATVGSLAKQQEDRFQAFEHRLDSLADKFDDLALANPQFTPPESPGTSESASASSDTSSISSHHSNMPRILRSDMAPATVADVGGYFYPNCDQLGDSDQQYISDVSTFVGRVNRVRQTKSINNIEIFLRGPALRWFHIGLRSDGTHVFDMYNGKFGIVAFCDTLILLFGVPESFTSATHLDSLHLIAPCMRSDIIEDYVFPALEYVRPQENFFYSDSGTSIAVSEALALYNQSSEPCTVNPEIFNCTSPHEILDCDDLLYILGRLRHSEFEQKLDRNRQHLANVASSKGMRGKSNFTRAQQEPVSAPVTNSGCKLSTSTPAGSYNNHLKDRDTVEPEAKSKFSTVKMPERVENEIAEAVECATEPYPPAPTAESCPATPIASCQPSQSDVNPASQIRNVGEVTRNHVASQSEEGIPLVQNEATYSFLDYSGGAGGVDLRGISREKFAYNKIEPSVPVFNKTTNEFGVQPGCQPTDEEMMAMQRKFCMQELAQLQQNTTEEQEVAFPTSYSSHNPGCQQSSVLAAHQRPGFSPLDNISQVKGDSPSTVAGLAHGAQFAAEINAENGIDSSRSITASTKPYFVKLVLDDSRLNVLAPAYRCPFLQKSAEINAILDDIPQIPAPDPLNDNADGKVKWYYRPKDDSPAPEAGALAIPEGADNCLVGLTFAFTGQLTYISIEEGQKLVKHYGGKCITAPSRKTSFVVLGANSGPRKLRSIKQYNLRVIDEKGLFALISRLPARNFSVCEQEKEVERPKNVTEDVLTTTTIPCQELDCIPAETPSYQPQQQPQMVHSSDGFPLDPHARAFLDGFRVFPPVNINPNTPEYKTYKSSVLSNLGRQLSIHKNSISRIKDVYGVIAQSENARLTVTPDLWSVEDAAKADLQAAKNEIDAIRAQNEKNRAAWFSKPFTPQSRQEFDDLLAAQDSL